jgi:class 3 adenylate cyclase
MGEAPPTTQYVEVDGLHVAYQVIGNGPIDLVFHHGFCHLDLQWDIAAEAAFHRRLASFSRLILFDRRGTGASERLHGAAAPTVDEWTTDLLAVLDAVESESAALFFETEAGPVAINFVDKHPERVQALVLANTAARWAWAEDYPDGWSDEVISAVAEDVQSVWGTARFGADWPLLAADPIQQDALARLLRAAATPGMAAEHIRRVYTGLDVRDLLGGISVPTLVVSTPGNQSFSAYLASRIPGAQLLETQSASLVLYGDDFDEILSEVASFLTGNAAPLAPQRQLLSTVFTDIVSSTERLGSLGDRRWSSILDAHDRSVRRQLDHFGGREVNTTGDGFVAVFDTPSAAVRCARAIVDALAEMQIDVRAGVHAGECELRGDDIAGMAVHIAARVAGAAAPGEVLVSRTIVDLLLGSGLHFAGRSEHTLKGLPEPWLLYAFDSE